MSIAIQISEITSNQIESNQQNEADPVSVLVISCARWDNLKETLNSFEIHNTYSNIVDKFVIDDCNDTEGLHNMSILYSDYKFVQTTVPRTKNLSASMRRTYLSVREGIFDYVMKNEQIEFVFHMEDDWKFYRSGFIEDSLAIMKSEQNAKKHGNISGVGLRNFQTEYYVKDGGKIERINTWYFCGGHGINEKAGNRRETP